MSPTTSVCNRARLYLHHCGAAWMSSIIYSAPFLSVKKLNCLMASSSFTHFLYFSLLHTAAYNSLLKRASICTINKLKFIATVKYKCNFASIRETLWMLKTLTKYQARLQYKEAINWGMGTIITTHNNWTPNLYDIWDHTKALRPYSKNTCFSHFDEKS